MMTSEGAGVESLPGLTVADGLQILREDRGEDLRLSSSREETKEGRCPDLSLTAEINLQIKTSLMSFQRLQTPKFHFMFSSA